MIETSPINPATHEGKEEEFVSAINSRPQKSEMPNHVTFVVLGVKVQHKRLVRGMDSRKGKERETYRMHKIC